MKPQLVHSEQSTYNDCVKQTYVSILKQTKALLSTIEEEPLRYTLTREDKPIQTGAIIHELINPLLYLRLEVYSGNIYGIHYGYERSPTFGAYYPVTNQFIRLLYKATMASATPVNIEDCIRTDWIITDCADMYEHVEERGKKHHSFHLIKHRPKGVKRKLQKVA